MDEFSLISSIPEFTSVETTSARTALLPVRVVSAVADGPSSVGSSRSSPAAPLVTLDFERLDALGL